MIHILPRVSLRCVHGSHPEGGSDMEKEDQVQSVNNARKEAVAHGVMESGCNFERHFCAGI